MTNLNVQSYGSVPYYFKEGKNVPRCQECVGMFYMAMMNPTKDCKVCGGTGISAVPITELDLTVLKGEINV